jgi:hypothetical protein
MALVAVLALFFGLLRPFAPPASPSASEVAASAETSAAFGPLELIGTAWDQPASGDLTLYWRAMEQVQDDLRTVVRLLDAQGALVWEWKRSPGAGRLSTDRWPTGRIVADTYQVPDDVWAKTARVEVGLRPFPEGPWLRSASGGDERLALPLP